MNTEAQFATFTIPDRKKKVSGNIVTRYLFHWPLYLIAIGICMTGAYLYTKNYEPGYSIKAVVNIKEGKPETEKPTNEKETKSAAQDEIEILRSQRVVKKVIDDLGLGVAYQKKVNGVFKDIYRNVPVRLVKQTNSNNDSEVIDFDSEFTIVVKDNSTFLLVLPDGSLKTYSYNTVLQNYAGEWKLQPVGKIRKSDESSNIKIHPLNAENIALQYQKSITAVQTDKLSSTIILSTSDVNPQRGKDILNSLIRNYRSIDVLDKEGDTKKTIDFLDKRLLEVSAEIKAIENKMGSLESSQGLSNIVADPNIGKDNIRNNDTRLNDINIQLSIVDGIDQYINSSENSGKIPSTIGLSDPALISSIEKLSQVQLQREKLLATLPETNPDFEPINRQIAILRTSIHDNVRNMRSSLIKTKQKLQSINSGIESSIRNIPTEGRDYENLKREKSIKEALYTEMLQKREAALANYTTTLAGDRVVDQAYAEQQKSKKPMMLGAAFFLSLVLPTGFIFLRDKISGRIMHTGDIQDVLNVPVLSELPYEKKPLSHKNQPKENTSAVIEQFRTLRTKLYYIHSEKGITKGRVTLLTSSIPEEGKSFVSSNLGFAIASAERKTVILEMDLRRPKISETFNLQKEHKGITDYLREQAAVEDIIQHSVLIPHLDVIGAGKNVHNPSELLEKKQLAELISQLRSRYDDIIIDSPPLHLVSDALLITKFCDATLYMVRQGFTKKAELKYIKELYEQKQLTDMYIIFNGIQRVKYGYGYDYNNNYYSTPKKKNPLNAVFSDFLHRF